MDPITLQPEQSSVSSAISPEPPKHFLNKKFAITFVVLILLGAGAFGYTWWRYGGLSPKPCGVGVGGFSLGICPVGFICEGHNPPNPDAGGVCVRGTSSSPQPTDEATNLKTYTNTQYGFEFKYPNGWSVFDKGPNGITIRKSIAPKEDDLGLDYLQLDIYASSTDFMGGSVISMGGGREADKVFAGATWRVAREDDGTPGSTSYPSNLSLDTKYQNKFFGITFYPYATFSGDPLVDQILSTFKFIDSVDTSTWKTYTNTKSGFEVKYPKEWWNGQCLEQDGSIAFVAFDSRQRSILCESDYGFFPVTIRNIKSTSASEFERMITDNMSALDNAARTQVYISGQPAVKVAGNTKASEGPGPGAGIDSVLVILNHGGYIWTISYLELSGKDYSSIFNQILSTFKFTK